MALTQATTGYRHRGTILINRTAYSMFYLQFEFIACSQTRMVAFLCPGHDDALVVRGVALEQIFQVVVALRSYKRRKHSLNLGQINV